MNKKFFIKFKIIFILAAACLLTSSLIVYGWTGPSLAPPEGNVSRPLHVGPEGQEKAGGLWLNTGGAATGLIIEHGNVGIGTTSPNQQLEITGNFRVPTTTYANQSGIIYKGANRFIHDFNYGYNGTVTTEGMNTFVGINAGNFTMGSTATGSHHASRNTGIGYSALSANTTGYDNATVGTYALYFNTTGAGNSAMGAYALRSNTTGASNSAMGLNALYFNTTGLSNSAMGVNALFSNTTGYNNSAMGRDAGRYLADGSANQTSNNSVFLGYNTRASVAGGSNEIVIGASAIGAGSNSVVLGNDNITKTLLKGNVGIGTTSPAQKLHVVGYARADSGFCIGTSCITAWPEGEVTGTGTTNYLPIWTTSSNIGNSAIYQSGSNVGIGTTSPSHKLTLTGGNLAIESGNLYLSSDQRLLFDYGVSNDYAIQKTGTNLLFSTGGAFSFNNNVGIGTTSPAQKLHVAGYARADSGFCIGTSCITAWPEGEVTGTGTTNYLPIWTTSSNIGNSVVYQSGTNVGIGTTNAVGKLHVNAAASSAGIVLSVSTDNLDTPYILFGDRTGNNVGAGIGTSAGGGYGKRDIVFLTSNVDTWSKSIDDLEERMRITKLGNVGIGTTSPAQKLHVAGYARADSGFCIGTSCITAWPEGEVTGTGTANYLPIWTTSSNIGNSVVYQSGSNIGIGTTTPAYKQDISGSLRVHKSVFGRSVFGSTNFDTPRYSKVFSQDIPSLGTIGTTYLRVNINGHDRSQGRALVEMLISGRQFNVQAKVTGILEQKDIIVWHNTDNSKYEVYLKTLGWTWPWEIIEITSNVTTGVIEPAPEVVTSLPNGSLVYSVAESTANLVLIEGNVGIGTTTPAQKLHVAGYARADSGFCIGTSCITAWPEGEVTGTGTTNYLPIWTTSSNIGNSVVYQSGTNVGIGTTSPTDILDVFSASNNQRLIRLSHPSTPTAASGFLGFNSDGTTDNNVVTFGVQYSSTYYNVINIQRSTRNVGIGTTSPAQKLHVAGYARADSGFCIGTSCITAWPEGEVTGTGTTNYLPIWTTSSNIGNSVVYQSGTNIGIGTTGPKPVAKLDVSGVVLAGDASATSGSLAFGVRYNDTDIPNTFGSHYSSAATVIGYGARAKQGSSGFVSSAGNTNWSKGAIVLTDQFVFYNAPQETVPVGSDLTMTERFRITDTGYARADSGFCIGTSCITAWPEGEVTGTGTANYLPIWTTSSNIGNSAIYQSGTNIGIGTTSPNQQLEITGNFRVPTTTYANQSGIIYKGADRFIHDFNYGYNGTVTTTGQNTFVGIQAGNFTMGSTATLSSQSSYNTGIGFQALLSNTTGNYNSAMGVSTLRANTSGHDNSAMGAYALYANTTGFYNSAMGVQTLQANTTGSRNSAMGMWALYANTTGSYNSAMGLDAGRYLADGSANQTSSSSIFLGYDTRASVAGGSNEIVIGASAIGAGSNSVVLGNNSITKTLLKGNVGIGTTTPAQKLHVAGYARADSGFCIGTSCITAWPEGEVTGTGTTNYLPIWTTSSNIGNSVVYQSGSNIGIGTTSPSVKFDVAGTARVRNVLRAGNWRHVLSTGFSSTATNGYLLTTTIPFDGTVGRGMHSIRVQGYAYDQYNYVDFVVNFYLYTGGSKIIHDGLTNFGSYNPGNVKLSYEGDVLKLWWSNTVYYPSFEVFTTSWIGSVDTDSHFENWSITDAPAPTTNVIDVTYRNATPHGLTMLGNIRLNGNWLSRDATNNGIFIDGSHNVGIGTASPAQKLHVAGYARADSGFCIGTSCITAWPEGEVTGTGTANYLPIWTTSSNIGNSIVYQSGSRIGFNTNSPQYRMDVVGASDGGPLLRLRTPSTSTGVTSMIQFTMTTDHDSTGQLSAFIGAKRTNSPASGANALVFGTSASVAAATERMRIDPSGNVGIGTTTPAQKLHVAGYARADSGFCIGTSCITAWPEGEVTGTGTANYLPIWTTSSNIGNSAIYQSGSNIGIGTTGPSQQLEITGNFRVPTTTYANQSGIIYKGADRFIHDFNYGYNGTVTTSGMNTFVGINAGNFTMGSTATASDHASGNTGIGYQALLSNTTGSYNSAMGRNTLLSNTTGHRNSAMGVNALYSNTTGHRNSAMGLNALFSNTTGYDNSAIGAEALSANTTGSYNSAMGAWALFSDTTGSYNSAMGVDAGRYLANGTANETSSSSVFLGYNTRASVAGGSNEIVIGASAIGAGSNSVVLGNDNITKTLLKGNVGIGTATPAQKLHVAGYARADSGFCIGTSCITAWPEGEVTGTGTTNYLPIWTTSNNIGNSVVYQSGTNIGIGITSPNQQLEITGNFRVPTTTYANQSGIIYKGADRFIHDFNYGYNGTVTTSGMNTFIGIQAGNFTMGSTATQTYEASLNTGIGHSVLYYNTTGYRNSAIGAYALYANTTGSNNSAIGRSALYSNTTGSNNSAMGYYALFANTTGSLNSAMGVDAGRFLADGSANATSNNSVFLGYNTRASVAGGSNEIVIGASAIGAGSNSVVLGNNSITKTLLKGNVGIGTTTPAQKLHVAGYARADSGFCIGTSCITAWPEGEVTGTGTANYLPIWTTSSNIGNSVVYQSGTQVGIGLTNPGYALEVSGDVKAFSFLSASDASLKMGIGTLGDDVLGKVTQLRGISFHWKDSGEASIGFLAEEVEKIFPEVVFTDRNGIKSIDYSKLVAPLTEAIKEQQKQAESQQQQIERLIAEIEELKKINSD